MNKLLIAASLLLAISPLAHAQARISASKDHSKHPKAVNIYNERQLHASELARKRRVLVQCRDGSKHIARVCRRHGGVAG